MSLFFVGDATLAETLQRVSDLAGSAVAASDMVGITMLVEGRADRGVHRRVDAGDRFQSVRDGQRACLDAFRQQQVFRIEDMETDAQWPAFSEAAAAHGLRSSMSLPLVARHEGVGALNFYARSPAAFSDGDVEVGLQFASQAAIVLANSQAYWDAHQLGEDLAQAMRSRATIEQAKGILMGAQRCSPDEAFQILVRASQREKRKLREVAEDVVAKATESRRRTTTV